MIHIQSLTMRFAYLYLVHQFLTDNGVNSSCFGTSNVCRFFFFSIIKAIFAMHYITEYATNLTTKRNMTWSDRDRHDNANLHAQ